MVVANETSRVGADSSASAPGGKYDRPHAAGSSSAAVGWGEGLAYPEWVQGLLPAVHRGFNGVNKYVSVPALKMGLGPYMSNPLTGYLMMRSMGEIAGMLGMANPWRDR